MRSAARPLSWSAVLLASALSASAQPRRAIPPVLSTQASPPAGATSEPAQMSGYALQVGDLPPGIVAIRVIRESFRTNVPNQTVLLRVGDSNRVLSAVTNTEGRVQFDGLRVGESVRVRAAVGAEVLESQRFEVPAQGGVRMVLVSGVGAGVASPSDPWPAATVAPASVPIAPPPTPMAPPAATTPATTAPVPAREAPASSHIGFVAAGVALSAVAGMWLVRRRAGATAQASRDAAVERPARPGAPPAAGGAGAVMSRDERDALFEQLVRLEQRARAGQVEEEAYAKRREALIQELVALDASREEPGADVTRP